MAFNLKLPNFLSGTNSSAAQTISDVTVMDVDSRAGHNRAIVGLGFLNNYSVAKKLQESVSKYKDTKKRALETATRK